jgi:hypothetical protein
MIGFIWNPTGTQAVPFGGRNQAFQCGNSASNYNGDNGRHFDRDTGSTRYASEFNSKSWYVIDTQVGGGVIPSGYNSTNVFLNIGGIWGTTFFQGNGKKVWIRSRSGWSGSGGSGGTGGNGQNGWIRGQNGNAGSAAMINQGYSPEIIVNKQGSTFLGGGGGGGGGTGWRYIVQGANGATKTSAGGGGGGGASFGIGSAGGNSELGTGSTGTVGGYSGGGAGGGGVSGAGPGGAGGAWGENGGAAPNYAAGNNNYLGQVSSGGAKGQLVQGSYGYMLIY